MGAIPDYEQAILIIREQDERIAELEAQLTARSDAHLLRSHEALREALQRASKYVPNAVKKNCTCYNCETVAVIDAALTEAAARTDSKAPREEQIKRDQIERMVNRFLQWKLPENFNPDGGISFKIIRNENTQWPAKNEPVGTNLLDAIQAEEMVRYMLGTEAAALEPQKEQP